MVNQRTLLIVSAVIFVVAGSGLGLMFGNHDDNILPSILGTNTTGSLIFKAPEKVIINEPFEMTVQIDTKGKNVNAVGVYLRFEPQKIQLMQMDTSPSFCQFYPEKKFDNQLGLISLACGSPHPGMNGTSTLMVLQFTPISLGQMIIRTDSQSRLLVSDGKGTNILKEFPNLSVNVVNNL
jgi:hypothetical protein